MRRLAALGLALAALAAAAAPALAATAPQFTQANPPLDVVCCGGASGSTSGSFANYAFAANGSPAPTFSIASGALPTGVTLDANTGELTGYATGTGPFTFSVKASNGVAPDAAAGPFSGQAYTLAGLPPCDGHYEVLLSDNGQNDDITVFTASTTTTITDAQATEPDLRAAATHVLGRAAGVAVYDNQVAAPASDPAAAQLFAAAGAAALKAAPADLLSAPTMLSQTTTRSDPVDIGQSDSAPVQGAAAVTTTIGPATIHRGPNLDCTYYLLGGQADIDLENVGVITRTHHMQSTATRVSTYAVDAAPAPLLTPVTGTPPVTTLPTAAQLGLLLGLPSAQACVSKRRFKIHLRPQLALSGTNVAIRSVTVKLGSKTIAKAKKPGAVTVDLRGLKKGKYTLTVVATTTDGRTLTGKTAYHTCAKRH